MKTQDKLPKILLYRLEKIIPPGSLQSVLHAFTVKRPTTIRVNTLKISARDLRNLFFEMGIKLHNVEWYKDAFIVKNRSLREIRLLKEYQEGLIYVQSLSSMIPPLILDAKPNEKILDMCAAPGSKTTQIAAMMENKGEILANEVNPIRLEKLKANLKMQGVANTYTSSFTDEIIGKKFEDFFDKTLVDAPCSGEGRINIFKPETYKGWSLDKVRRFASLQRSLLKSAVKATRPGGRIVYSTCTLSPEENEEVIDWILEKEEGNIAVEQFSIFLPAQAGNLKFSNSLNQWEGREYNKQIAKIIRIMPSATMEGFFVASLKKK